MDARRKLYEFAKTLEGVDVSSSEDVMRFTITLTGQKFCWVYSENVGICTNGTYSYVIPCIHLFTYHIKRSIV